MHIFQEQLITGQKPANYDLKNQSNMEPIVDLQNQTVFEEHFFLVVMERLPTGGSVIHTWRIIISSQGKHFLITCAQNVHFHVYFTLYITGSSVQCEINTETYILWSHSYWVPA